MTKSSAVNGQEAAQGTVSVTRSSLVVRGDILTIQTQERVELTDVTDRVVAIVREAGVREGMLNVQCSMRNAYRIQHSLSIDH